MAPQQCRYHPLVRDTVQAIAHAEPRPNEDLRAFAAWLGIDSVGSAWVTGGSLAGWVIGV